MKCKTCNREYVYSKKAGHTKTVCNSCTVNKRRFKLKIQCIEYKGGKCNICGYDKCTKALEFHHPNDDKSFGIGGSHCRKWESIKEELDKCILVCANCHRELHS